MHDATKTHPVFIGSEIYRGSSYGAQHPLSIPRVPTVTDLCEAMGWFAPGQFRISPRAKPKALHAFHTPEYVAALEEAETTQSVSEATRARHGLGTLSNPVFAEMFRRPATAAGGSLLAAELLSEGGIVYNPGGGTHHGMADRAAGFCYLNDPVLAVKAFLAQGLTRVAYLDIDAHHCDGVAAALANEPRVLMISTHEEARWPFTGALEDESGVNLPLPKGADDSDFFYALEHMVVPLIEGFGPEAIVLQCGADAVAEDPLARLSLSNNAHWAAVRAMMGLSPRLLTLGGGGYNPWSVGRLWAGVWATLNGYEIPERLPEKARAALAGLTWARQRGPVPDYLLETLRDAPRESGVSQETRDRVAVLRARFARWV